MGIWYENETETEIVSEWVDDSLRGRGSYLNTGFLLGGVPTKEFIVNELRSSDRYWGTSG